MLRTKSIFDEISKEDGLRISVMSRHTLNDGVTPDSRIVPNVTYDLHVVELAPPAALVGLWYKNKINWENFTRTYLDFLNKPEPARAVRELAEIALRRDITVLCVEPPGERCHRVILAQRCKEIQPALEIRHV
ncbi:MAG: DUF488 domain-containing protein [Candidatus Micrarchaeaceae archaeon]|jgi:uncharacterized protein YeaO (DUF488 family)